MRVNYKNLSIFEQPMDRFQKILVAIICLLIGIAVVLLFENIIIYVAPFFIGYLLYQLFASEDRYRMMDSFKVIFNLGTTIEEVYLIRNDGILLTHHTRRLKPYTDQDILAGMLKAITNFVKEAFPTHGSTDLNEIKFRDKEIQIATGRLATLAVVISGVDKESTRKQMIHCVSDLERKCGQTIQNYSCKKKETERLERFINKFIEGDYSPTGSTYRYVKKKVQKDSRNT